MSKVDDFVKFSQEDADEYVLRLFGDDGPEPDGEWVLSMSTSTAVELYEALEKTLGGYVSEMRAAKASHARGEGPDGEPRGTWDAEEMADNVLGALDPKNPRYLENADTIRDRMRGK